MSKLKITDPECWEALGVTPSLLRALSQTRCASSLDKVKAEAKNLFRAMAMDLHPDRNGGDPDKEKTLMRFSNANDEVQGLQFAAGPPPGAPRTNGPRVTIIMPGGRMRTQTTATGAGFVWYTVSTTG